MLVLIKITPTATYTQQNIEKVRAFWKFYPRACSWTTLS